LIVGLSGAARGLELGSPVGQDGLRKPIANKRFIHHLVDIDSILAVKPLAIGDEPAVAVESVVSDSGNGSPRLGLHLGLILVVILRL
jgi:hypothetical protein